VRGVERRERRSAIPKDLIPKELLAKLAALGAQVQGAPRAAERRRARPGLAKRAHRGRQRRSTRRVEQSEQGRDPSVCVYEFDLTPRL
jgi:hypothetical protein